MPMPDINALPENFRLPLPRTTATAPYSPMSSSPIPNLPSEHAGALHADSRTNTHSEPIRIAAIMAATNALRYPLFMSYPLASARIISSHLSYGNPFVVYYRRLYVFSDFVIPGYCMENSASLSRAEFGTQKPEGVFFCFAFEECRVK